MRPVVMHIYLSNRLLQNYEIDNAAKCLFRECRKPPCKIKFDISAGCVAIAKRNRTLMTRIRLMNIDNQLRITNYECTAMKTKTLAMGKLLIMVAFLLSGVNCNGQELKELHPTIGITFDFTEEAIKRFNSEEAYKKCQEVERKIRVDQRSYDKVTLEEKEILKYCDETKESIWEIIGGGASWYNGGGTEWVGGSSFLPPQGDITYTPDNAHDLNYKTAWVPSKGGNGVGEYLEYCFAAESARITQIIVANGYVKSKAAWENNARVKKLKLYINNEPYAILNLKDVYAEQSFEVEPIGNSNRDDYEGLRELPQWTLKFEIMEVYKGKKYDDVAITEIYFDGLDILCFVGGTKITLHNKSTINIEELEVGDKVLTYDFERNELIEATVLQVENVVHSGLVTYVFENGMEITSTKDHPFRIKEKGWCSLLPKKSEQYKGIGHVGEIEIGNLFEVIDKNSALITNRLIQIKDLEKGEQTYTISKLDVGDNFIANGFIVAVEELE